MNPVNDDSIYSVHYSLSCTPQEAFDVLADLAAHIQPSQLLNHSIFDAHDQLIQITFPWCILDPNAHQAPVHRMFGQILIQKNALLIGVNSKKCAEEARI